MRMIGFVRLAHIGRKNSSVDVCIYCRDVGVVLECYMSVVAGCSVVLLSCLLLRCSREEHFVRTSFFVRKVRIAPSRLIAQMSSEIGRHVDW